MKSEHPPGITSPAGEQQREMAADRAQPDDQYGSPQPVGAGEIVGSVEHARVCCLQRNAPEQPIPYFVQIHKAGDAGQDVGQRKEGYAIRHMVPSVPAKVDDACDEVDYPADITQQPQHQKRKIRHHRGIADALFPLSFEQADMLLACCPLFMQGIFGRTHRNASALNVLLSYHGFHLMQYRIGNEQAPSHKHTGGRLFSSAGGQMCSIWPDKTKTPASVGTQGLHLMVRGTGLEPVTPCTSS